jgi:hypothetical protein
LEATRCERGFGEWLDRASEKEADIRPILLGTQRYFANQAIRDEQGDLPVHPEEEQVGKDTNRSFVSYPRGQLSVFCENDELIIGIPQESKMEMKADLYDLIVNVLSQYPGLSYFQVSLCTQCFLTESAKLIGRGIMILCLSCI